MVACICHSPLHQKPDFEGQSVIKTSSYLLPFVLEAHRESLPRSCETSARRLSAESAEVYSTADLPASAAHTFPSQHTCTYTLCSEPFTFAARVFFFFFSCNDFAACQGIPKDKRKAALEEKIEEMGLRQYCERPASGCSGGNKRKLSVAIAMIGDPQVRHARSRGETPQCRLGWVKKYGNIIVQ